MGGEKDKPPAPNMAAAAARVVDFGNVDYVVVEKDTREHADESSSKSSNFVPPADMVVVEREDADARQDTLAPGASFTAGSFQAVGASLSESAISSASSRSSSTAGNSTGTIGSVFQQGRATLLSSPTLRVSCRGRRSPPPPSPPPNNENASTSNDDASVEIAIPPAIVSTVACVCAWWSMTQEHAVQLREKAVIYKDKATDAFICAQRCARRKWAERGPPPPALERLVKHRLFPVLLVLLLSLVVTLPGYWALPGSRAGQRRVSNKEWQAKYEDLERKYAAQSNLANEYTTLGAKHTSLQEEHDALLNFIKVKERRSPRERIAAAGSNAERQADASYQKAGADSCGKDSIQGPVQAMRDTFVAAEKSAYEMFKHFSDGLKEDVHEILRAVRGTAHVDGDSRDKNEKTTHGEDHHSMAKKTSGKKDKNKHHRGKEIKGKAIDFMEGDTTNADKTSASVEESRSIGDLVVISHDLDDFLEVGTESSRENGERPGGMVEANRVEVAEKRQTEKKRKEDEKKRMKLDRESKAKLQAENRMDGGGTSDKLKASGSVKTGKSATDMLAAAKQRGSETTPDVTNHGEDSEVFENAAAAFYVITPTPDHDYVDAWDYVERAGLSDIKARVHGDVGKETYDSKMNKKKGVDKHENDKKRKAKKGGKKSVKVKKIKSDEHKSKEEKDWGKRKKKEKKRFLGKDGEEMRDTEESEKKKKSKRN